MDPDPNHAAVDTLWTPDQVAALAPDANSMKAAQGLASPARWEGLGRDTLAAWGEIRGSGSSPYQTQIDLSGPAFHCSCPSRKVPCKHALGLFLLLVTSPQAVSTTIQPGWVRDWLTSRARRATGEQPAGQPSRKKTADPQAQARRAAKREQRVSGGIQELELWLRDLLRQGLAAARDQPPGFWETPASRLVDAQAPGLARRVREMAGIAASGQGWQDRLLRAAARLYLIMTAYPRLDMLSGDLQAELRTLIGWNQNQEDLLQQGDGVRDHWLVAAQWIREENTGTLHRAPNLRAQRTWLWGQEQRQAALVLDFAAVGQPLNNSLIPGSMVEGEVVFFPGAYPIRALVRSQLASPAAAAAPAGDPDLGSAYGRYAAALAANPWLEIFPFMLADVRPIQQGKVWHILDRSGRALPVAARFPAGWQLYALSGGYPLHLFAEWDGEKLWPLSAWADGRWVFFPGN